MALRVAVEGFPVALVRDCLVATIRETGFAMNQLKIRKDRTPAVLRKLAKAEPDARVARRLLGIANALSGMNRAAAAASAGMDRQTLRDWVIRYNEHGVIGLCDRWSGGGAPPPPPAAEGGGGPGGAGRPPPPPTNPFPLSP